MIDHIMFDAPFWLLGDLTEAVVLASYQPKLIEERNTYLSDEVERT